MALHLSLPEGIDGDARRFELAPETVSAWLAALPADDPFKAGRMIFDQLVPLNRSRVRITLRQDVTEALIGYCGRMLPQLGATLATGTLPLAQETRNAAALAEDLLTEFAYSYKLLLVEQSRRLMP